MPYISTEKVKEIRTKLNITFPEIKFSVRCHNYCSIRVSILSAPNDIITDPIISYRQSINNHTQVDDLTKYGNIVVSAIDDIVNSDKNEESYDGDYGSIPTYYSSIDLGKYDKPFIINPINTRKIRKTRKRLQSA